MGEMCLLYLSTHICMNRLKPRLEDMSWEVVTKTMVTMEINPRNQVSVKGITRNSIPSQSAIPDTQYCEEKRHPERRISLHLESSRTAMKSEYPCPHNNLNNWNLPNFKLFTQQKYITEELTWSLWKRWKDICKYTKQRVHNFKELKATNNTRGTYRKWYSNIAIMSLHY